MDAERLPASVEILPERARQEAMADCELAANLLDDVIGTRGVREPVKSMLERAYAELSRKNRAWTRRRVRALFHKESNRIDYREICEMREVVEARKRHAEYRQETTRIASMALVRASSRDSDLAPRQGSRLGGMDLPRAGGE